MGIGYGSITVTEVFDGETGPAGLNNATVTLYQRATSSPATPSEDTTYTFSTGVLSGTLGNWTQTIPSGTNPVWATVATASSTSTTDTIGSTEWTTPLQILANGTNGDSGYNQATVFLYQRKSGDAPAKPSALSQYWFSNGALSPVPDGWSRTIPTANGNPCYVTTAAAIAKTDTVTLQASAWSNVVKLVEDGVGVTMVSQVIEYKLSLSSDYPDVLFLAIENEDCIVTEDGDQIIVEPNDDWSVDIPAAVPGMYLWTRTTTTYSDGTETVTYSVASTGRGIDHVTTYYYLSSSESELVDGDWMQTIPPYVEGKYYWTKDETFYTDGTSEISEPELDYILNTAEYTKEMAERTDKHFFVDEDGVHITVGDNMPNEGKNVRITNEGMQIRNGTESLSEFSDSKVQIGTDSNNNVLITRDGVSIRNGIIDAASFKSDGTRIGEENGSHVSITPESTVFYNVDGYTKTAVIDNAVYSSFVKIETLMEETSSGENLKYLSNTTRTVTLSSTPVNIGSEYPLMKITAMIQNYLPESWDANHYIVVGGYYYNYEGGTRSYSGSGTLNFEYLRISFTYNSANEEMTISIGNLNFDSLNKPRLIITVEYYTNEPSARYSFGVNANATGRCAFASGYNTTASGMYSHAHGNGSVSEGHYSFATGLGTIASGEAQTVIGKYNAEDSYPLFIIGGGSDGSHRKNVFEVRPSGFACTQGEFLTRLSDIFGRNHEEIKQHPQLQITTDLNSYDVPGHYYAANSSADPVQYMYNAPFTDRSFDLLVFGFGSDDGQTLQFAWSNNTSGYLRYRIRNNSGTWGSWRDLATGAGALSSYLTTSAASSTYLTKTSASSTYAAMSTPTFTAASGFSVNSSKNKLSRSGKIVCVNLGITNSSALTSGTNYIVGTVSVAPAVTIGLFGKRGNETPLCAYVSTDKYIRIIPNAAVSASTAIEISGSYVTA